MLVKESKRMLGLISAMQTEMEQLLSELKEPVMEQAGGMTFHRGELCGRPVVLSVCGPGKVNAALCAQTMLLNYKPEAVLNLGVAGSIDPDINIGDIVIGTFAVQHDMDTTPIGDPPGYISGISLVQLPLDVSLQDKLRRALEGLPDVRGAFGGIATGDQFLQDGGRRAQVREQFKALCCEMEGGAVAHACYVNHTPCAVVRAISDRADGSSNMDYFNFLTLAAEKSTALVRRFLQET